MQTSINKITQTILNDIQHEILKTTETVILQMNNNPVLIGDVIQFQEKQTSNDINIIAPIRSNKIKGYFALCIDEKMAKKLCQKIWNLQDLNSSIILDGVGEILNLVFGNAKAALNKFGYSFEIVPYQKKMGRGLDFPEYNEHHGIRIPIQLDGIEFFFVIDLNGEQINISPLTEFRPINISEIKSDYPLEFDLFYRLENNKKTLLYKKAGDIIEGNKLRKFFNFQVKYMYVRTEDFYKHQNKAAEEFIQIVNSELLPEEKRLSAIAKKVTYMIRDVFVAEEDNSHLIENAIDMIVKIIPKGDQFSQLRDVFIKSNANYDGFEAHAMRVVGLSLILGLAMGYESQEALNAISVGGLLHDFGFVQIPQNVYFKPYTTLNTGEISLYQKHPNIAIEMLRTRNVVIEEEAKRIILEHHEKANGKGFPRYIKQNSIHDLSQIVAFSDFFDDLKYGRFLDKKLNSLEALEYIISENEKDKKFNPKLLEEITQIIQHSINNNDI